MAQGIRKGRNWRSVRGRSGASDGASMRSRAAAVDLASMAWLAGSFCRTPDSTIMRQSMPQRDYGILWQIVRILAIQHLKRVAIFQVRTLRFRFLILRMSLSRNRLHFRETCL